MSSNRLVLSPASPDKPLSAARKRFNALVKKIERQRRTLQEWDEGERHFAGVWSREILPERREHFALMREMVSILDAGHDRLKLHPKEVETLRMEMSIMLEALLENGAHDEKDLNWLTSLHDKYSDVSVAEQLAEEERILKERVKVDLGIDIDDLDIDLRNPAAIMEEMLRRAEAQDAAAGWSEEMKQGVPHRGPPEHGPGFRKKAGWLDALYPEPDEPPHMKKPETAAQRRKRKAEEAAEQQATQSLQVIFRRLASTLHPDRETDPAERARKTELMQRITLAYREGRLLDLLELQFEAERFDMKNGEGLSDEQLKVYNKVLKRQSDELEEEIIEVEVAFLDRFGMDLGVRPRSLSRIAQDLLDAARIDNFKLRRQMAEVTDGRKLRSWLKAVRQIREERAREMARFERIDPFLDEY